MLASKPNELGGLERELAEAREELALVKGRMQSELQAAAAIQRALLPVKSPLVKGIRTAWRFRPSCALGGDILNIFLLNDRNIGFYILDVSGHGLAAALLSVAVSHFLSPFSDLSFLRDSGARGSMVTPAEVAARLNRQFTSHPEFTQFFTMFYGVLDTATHELVYVSAGHPAPVVLSREGGRLLNSTGMPVGVDVNAAYENVNVRLGAGDRLYLYSDGISEAKSADAHDLYDTERFAETARTLTGTPLNESLDRILESVDEWCGEEGADDDISLLAVEIQ